jgi:hypothetical protein
MVIPRHPGGMRLCSVGCYHRYYHGASGEARYRQRISTESVELRFEEGVRLGPRCLRRVVCRGGVAALTAARGFGYSCTFARRAFDQRRPQCMVRCCGEDSALGSVP